MSDRIDARKVEVAERKLTRAEILLNELADPNCPDAEETWEDFTGCVRSTFSTLEAATGSGTSKAWSDRLKAEKKSDQLLQYIYQSRNSAEYGNGPGAQNRRKFSNRRPVGNGDIVQSMTVTSRSPSGEVTTNGGPVFRFDAQSLPPQLVDVENRSVKYPVPQNHLGKPLETSDSFELGKLVIEYLARKVQEARAMLPAG